MPLTNIIPSATQAIKGLVELATTNEIQVGTDSERAITPAGFAATSLGWAQAYQDLTGSRAAATTYTNTTGKPKYVSVYGGGAGGGTIYIIVDGVQRTQHTNGSAVSNVGSAWAIIPPNSTYSVVVSSWTITRWSELG